MNRRMVIGCQKAAISIILVGLCLELSLRGLGINDFPIYQLADDVQYVPTPSQSGKLFGQYDWYFNNLSMPIRADFSAAVHPSVLMIGNSIVMGGNSYKQAEKLTALVQSTFGSNGVVWPVAVGGWTQINEMAYLDSHPEIANKADYLVWEYMSGGLSRATPWPGETFAPSHKPAFAALYVLEKYVLPILFSRASEIPVTGMVSETNIARFDAEIRSMTQGMTRKAKGIIWLYPKADELQRARTGREWLPERTQIARVARDNNLRIIDLATEPEWSSSDYRNDGVHPTVDGNKILADILCREIMKDGFLER